MENLKISFSCPVCSQDFEGSGYKKREYPANKADSGFCDNGPRFIFFCDNCKAGVAFPQLTEEKLAALYSKGGFWSDLKPWALTPKGSPGHYALAHTRWNSVVSFVKRGRNDKALSVLDVGSGEGFFGMVAAASRKVPLEKYCAVEKDPRLRQFLQDSWRRHYPKIGLEAHESLDSVKGRYDIAVLSNVLEHLNSPKSMLKAVAAKLADKGLIFVDVPNKDYLFKKDVFPHTLFFNKQSLEILLQESGLTVKHICGWGRSMDDSPINYRNEAKALVKIAGILHKARFIVPLGFLKVFFAYYFGSGRESIDGTWLRAVAQKI